MGLFDRVERGLERAVHGVFAKAFKAEVQPVEIASAMRRAMDDRAATVGHGRTFVPNLFTIELAPTDFERLTGYSDMLSDELVASAQEHAESQRYQPGGPIQVHFLSEEDLETGVFRVRPSTAKAAAAAAPAVKPAAPPAFGPESAEPVPVAPAPPRRHQAQRPWLDVDGDHYPLLAAITILGRDNSADVILDDPGISRQHTEIRVTNDGPHLVANIRDLGSTNGTFVNDERITSRRLADGDRVNVGRTALIFRAERR
ncbi:MAG: FHA domain-containing protein [Actinobacteria bacterium]|nr:FHA domain-containing protein [Actinomycetota bacterium]